MLLAVLAMGELPLAALTRGARGTVPLAMLADGAGPGAMLPLLLLAGTLYLLDWLLSLPAGRTGDAESLLRDPPFPMMASIAPLKVLLELGEAGRGDVDTPSYNTLLGGTPLADGSASLPEAAGGVPMP